MWVKGKKGFTLVELVCTVAVLGILLLIAVPEIMSIKDKWILDSTAKQMAEDIRWTQHLAQTEGGYYNFDIHISEYTYRIRDKYDSKDIKFVDIPAEITNIASTLPRNTNYHRLALTPTGIPTQTGTIFLTSAKDKKLRITIAVGTGRVAIFNGHE